MKHLKLFESFKEEDIAAICEKYGIQNYTINEDGSIDVDGTVYLDSRNFKELPLKFRNVSGNFFCQYNQLTSLEGVPQSLDGDFACHYNQLTSLEGAPKSIGGNFYCDYNQLASLEGCPKSVSGAFSCSHNQLTSLEDASQSVGGVFNCDYNLIYNIWILFEDFNKIEFFNDCDPIREPNIIILDRLNFFLEEIGKPTVTEVEGYKCI